MEKASEHCEDVFQLVEEDLKLWKNVKELFDHDSSNEPLLNTIGIIGSQGRGKSTLLNKMFDTDFKTQIKDKNGAVKDKGRTTIGTWAKIMRDKGYLIIDSEGTDWKKRAEQSAKSIEGSDKDIAERVISWFTLTISNVFMINIMWDAVGQTNGSWGTLFKNIANTCKDCLNGSSLSKKLIILVLRDYSDKKHKHISKLMKDRFETIWSGEAKDINISDYFEIEAATVRRNCIEPGFTEDVNRLNLMITGYIDKCGSPIPISNFPKLFNKVFPAIKDQTKISVEDSIMKTKKARSEEAHKKGKSKVQDKIK